MALISCPECTKEVSDKAGSCPHCGVQLQAPQIIKAKLKRKSEFAGTGCVLQGLGLVLLFFFPIGTIIGVVLLLVGSSKSVFWACSNCGNRLNRGVKQCPACTAQLK